MTSNIDPKKVVAAIPQSHTIFMSNLEGKKLKTSFQEIDPICQSIEKFKKTFLTHKGTKAIKFNPA